MTTIALRDNRIMRCLFIILSFLAVSESLASETPGSKAHPRQIALTFDDAPRSDGPFHTGSERTQALIAALASVDVQGAMFFVTIKNLDRQGSEGEARLRRYVDTGHVLANHSNNHLWLSRTPTDEYIADLDVAIARLAEFGSVMPYFRFPFLDEGRDMEKRDALRRAIKSRGLRNGYVTVDNYDWYMVTLAREALAAGHPFEMVDLRDAYVELLLDAIEFYDAMAIRTLGRSPKHVLLLHENDLAALFIDDLVRALKRSGWVIIPAIDAFTDPISNTEPDTLFLGQGRIAALAEKAGAAPRELVHITEDEDALRAEFIRRGLLPAQPSPTDKTGD